MTLLEGGRERRSPKKGRVGMEAVDAQSLKKKHPKCRGLQGEGENSVLSAKALKPTRGSISRRERREKRLSKKTSEERGSYEKI